MDRPGGLSYLNLEFGVHYIVIQRMPKGETELFADAHYVAVVG